MTPKEKAQELFGKYSNVALLDNYESKKCAVIAVDEIMQYAQNAYHNEDIIKGAKLYWKEVKQEIEKL